MIIYKELEPPTAVLSAFQLPGAAAADDGAPPPQPLLLLHRLDRLTRCSLAADGLGLELQPDDVRLPYPAAVVMPLPGGLVLAIGQGRESAFVLDVASPPQQHTAGLAAIVAEAALEPPTGGAAREGAAREPLAYGGCVASAPLTLRNSGVSGSGGSGSGTGTSTTTPAERTFVLASRSHGLLQLLSWSTDGSSNSSSSISARGRLESVVFRATPALLMGGLPGTVRVAVGSLLQRRQR